MLRSEGRGAGHRGFGALGLLGLVALVSLHLAWRHEPFDRSHGGQLSADSYGYSSRAFTHHGWWTLRGQPASFFLYGTLEGFEPYLHHPFAAYGVVYGAYRAGGMDAAALRLPSLVLVVLAAAGLFWAASPGASRATAALAVGLFATSPIVVQYGRMVESFVFGLGFLPVLVGAWFHYRRRPGTGRLLAFSGLAFLAAITNWYVFLLVPVLWGELRASRSRPARPRRVAVWVGVPFGLAALLHVGWLWWALGDPGKVLEEVRWLARVPSGAGMEVFSTVGVEFSFGQGLGGHLVRGYGPPLLGLAGLGVVIVLGRMLRGRTRPVDRVAMVLGIAGILPSLVFWRRCAGHEFWPLHTAPSVGLLAAIALRILAELPRRWAPAAALALAASILALSLVLGLARHEEFRADGTELAVAGELERRSGPGDVLLVPYQDYRYGLLFATHRSLVPTISSPELLAAAADLLRSARPAIGRVWLVGRRHTLTRPEMHWSASVPYVPGSGWRFEVGDVVWIGIEIDASRWLSRE